jgi:hypothetical protein
VSEAERLNADCHAAGLNRSALQQAMLAQGEAWHSLVTERCPHLFADVPVFISPVQLRKMYEVIAAVEQVVGLAGWQVASDEIRPAAKGVFFGYDFHLNEQGVHLIEINTNAGGAFLNELLIESQRDADLPGKAVAIENLDLSFQEMFRKEWRLERGSAPLHSIAIADEQPEKQYLYPEFLLAQRMLERAGIAAHITDPVAFKAREDGLYFGFEKIDLVYNRLTDFSLQQHPALRKAYTSGQVVLTPSPAHYARYADKRNLARLTDAEGLRSLGANEADIASLQTGVPHTFAVQSRHGGAQHAGAGGTASQLLPQSAGFASNVSQLHKNMEETLWQERKSLFFKPNSGYGSKGAYRGEKLTKRVFGEIMQSDYVAQKLAPPGERAVCVDDAEAVLLKYDVRCYVYDGQIQLVAARLYQGQTTNFRTPGGGFALVRVVE